MTRGQRQALDELMRLQAVKPNTLRIVAAPTEADGYLITRVSIQLGALERREGGLDLRDREEFTVTIPPDFPFVRPRLCVRHTRFKGFPHVTWTHALCLYQSDVEWDPADGLFGFFDRLGSWLGHAAGNEMDPVEGPLEPPHHNTDFDQIPIVVRANTPVPIDRHWVGWAVVRNFANRRELTNWRELGHDIEQEERVALAVMLDKPLPMEFPTRGGELFAELRNAGIDRDYLLALMSLAAHVTPENEPLHLVVGLPMRRDATGALRHHVAVWTTTAEYARYLRVTTPRNYDTDELRENRRAMGDVLYTAFEKSKLKWCRVFDDRSEIIVRRDARTPFSWFADKRVIVLGCGALGGWSAEMIARAKPAALRIVDRSVVNPGILARQNFTSDDVGANKALALARRLKAIDPSLDIQGFTDDAHAFLARERATSSEYDLILDCTASMTLLAKIERDWLTLGREVRAFASFMIDATAQRFIGVKLPVRSVEGPWSAYVRLKNRLCTDYQNTAFISAFYEPSAVKDLFQPEPGCSDPTFSGSMADVSGLVATALNFFVAQAPHATQAMGFAYASPGTAGGASAPMRLTLERVHQTVAGNYRILISDKALNAARAAVRENSRVRSPTHETGGLLWGLWNSAAGLIVVSDTSGPPPDSVHAPAHFLCGVEGTQEEHGQRVKETHGACGFVGLWHTHPDMLPRQSGEDMRGMTGMVTHIGQNQRRALMLIFGRQGDRPAAGFYVYESSILIRGVELVRNAESVLLLDQAVV